MQDNNHNQSAQPNTHHNERSNGYDEQARQAPREPSHDTNRPVDVLRDGQYKVSFWRNQGGEQDYISAKPAKTYTDKDGNPRDTQNFTVRDMLPLSKLCESAYERGRELEQGLRHEQRQAPQQQATRDNMQENRDTGKEAYTQQRQTSRQSRGQRQSRYVREK